MTLVRSRRPGSVSVIPNTRPMRFAQRSWMRSLDGRWPLVCAASGKRGDASQRDTIAEIVGVLDETGIPYMLTGSLVSSFHGEPRATLDIDVVVDPTESSLARLVGELETLGYYEYVSQWIASLGLGDLWDQASRMAE
jgi:hypothetical protein